MKISCTQNEYHQSGFRAFAEEQDGHPKVSWLFTDLAPSWFSGGRRALACALPFLNQVSGKITVDSKMSPLTASLIREMLPPGEIYIDSECVDFKPTDIQKGGSVLHVKAVDTVRAADDFVNRALKNDGGIRQTALTLVKNDAMRGFLSNPQYRIVASNFWLFEQLNGDSDSILGLSSLALMYSEDLSASKIIIYGDGSVDSTVREQFIQAFYSVGILLEFGNEK